jgi:transposase
MGIPLRIRSNEKNDKKTSMHFCIDSLVNQMRKQILDYFTGSFNNGFADGINQKINMLNRRGFGFRNFKSFRLYVLVAFLPFSR